MNYPPSIHFLQKLSLWCSLNTVNSQWATCVEINLWAPRQISALIYISWESHSTTAGCEFTRHKNSGEQSNTEQSLKKKNTCDFFFLFYICVSPPGLPWTPSCSPGWHPSYLTRWAWGSGRPRACWLSLSITLSQPLPLLYALSSCHSAASNLRQTAKCMPVFARWAHRHNVRLWIKGL